MQAGTMAFAGGRLHGSTELPLTQEYIAQMLGVRRTSVTEVARTLQKAGVIRYSRGHIKLLDVPARLRMLSDHQIELRRIAAPFQ